MIYDRLADHRNPRSLAAKLRRRRFQVLLGMLEGIPAPAKILDIGGRQQYWETMGQDFDCRAHVFLLNPEEQPVSLPNFTSIVGDGRYLEEFCDGYFDIVFSNSTIEHVGSFQDQQRMAGEVRRVGKRYYVQTPNKHFPIEPHFVFPLFQFLPLAVQVWLLRHASLGWAPRISDPYVAKSIIRSIRLITRSEFRQLFPDALILEEKFCGLAKSFVAYTPVNPRAAARDHLAAIAS